MMMSSTLLSSETVYANRHIPSFLSLPSIDVGKDDAEKDQDGGSVEEKKGQKSKQGVVQVVSEGGRLTLRNLAGKNDDGLSIHRPILVTDEPESIGMRVPKPSSLPTTSSLASTATPNKKTRTTAAPPVVTQDKDAVTVRDVADIVGHSLPVNVIDVEHQEELGGWTMGDLVDYFEDEERITMFHRQQQQKLESELQQQLEQHNTSTEAWDDECFRIRPALGRGARRQAAKAFLDKSRHRVLNQISLEFSATPLGEMVRSPQFVRDMDWIDHAWSKQWRAKGHYPMVQYYLLTSAAGCYTDFHLDFGGTSVWYHVLSGSKEFCLIEPTHENLQAYEDWLCRKNQSEIFLPDMISDKSTIHKIRLAKNQTFIIPSGWVHCVHTPEDSLVFGGNFMHGFDMSMQLAVNCIEVRTHVPERFRFPTFVSLQFFAASMYYKKLQRGDLFPREVEELPVIMDALEEWWNVYAPQAEQILAKRQKATLPTVPVVALEIASRHGFSTVPEFLSALRRAHALIKEEGIEHLPRTIPKLSISLGSSTSEPAKVDCGESVSTPRLRLKLDDKSVKKATIVKRVVPPPPAQNKARQQHNPFRISISAASKNGVSSSREDKDTIVDKRKLDEEWVPGGRAASGEGKKRKRANNSGSSGGGSISKTTPTSHNIPAKQNAARSRTVSSGKKKAVATPTTARQRLLKKTLGR